MIKIIEAEEASFKYEAEPVFENITFFVEQGDFTAIIGENGVGKSTFLKILLGELLPYAGSVRCLGQDIHSFNKWESIGYVPQHNLFSSSRFPATVAEVVRANLYKHVGLFRFPSKEHRQKTESALRSVGMEHYSGHFIGSLSGGQQQRVMLARALVAEPSLLILDEPTSGIDIKSKRGIYGLLSRINAERGITIIMVTHDITDVSPIVSRMLILDDGTLRELQYQPEGVWR